MKIGGRCLTEKLTGLDMDDTEKKFGCNNEDCCWSGSEKGCELSKILTETFFCPLCGNEVKPID